MLILCVQTLPKRWDTGLYSNTLLFPTGGAGNVESHLTSCDECEDTGALSPQEGAVVQAGVK